MKILIADADLITRTLLDKALQQAGYEVTLAASAEEAELQLVADAQLAAVVLDGKASAGFGAPLCARLRHRAGERPLFVVMMLKREDGGDVRGALDSGANEVINKPVNVDELTTRLALGLRLAEAEEALWSTRAYLGALMDHLDVGVLITAPDGRVAQANEALARVGGAAPEHLLGRERNRVRMQWDARGVPPCDCEPGQEDVDLPGRQRRVLRVTRARVSLPWGGVRLELCQDVSKEVLYDEFMEKSSMLDAVTGVLNRRGGETALRKAMDRARRHGEGLSVGALRIDNLPSLDEPQGLALADALLRTAAQTLLRLTRATDEVVRWSSNAFIVVLHNAARAQAQLVMGRLLKSIAALKVEGAPPLRLSSGMSECDPAEASAEALVGRALQALAP
ncbi:MAG: diguanylate cyclase [Myxococcales bacterium]|nr:diguanylate cyclase [Myxococcales bacterium]